MQLPSILQGESLTRLLQGAAAGAVATVIIGFNWGGWTLGSTAKQMSEQKMSAALVAVLAPMCVDKFRGGPDAVQQMVEFKKVSSWMQDSYIQKGGWATFPAWLARPRHRPGVRAIDALIRLSESRSRARFVESVAPADRRARSDRGRHGLTQCQRTVWRSSAVSSAAKDRRS